MSPDFKQMELDRLVNLGRSFSFEIAASSFTDDGVSADLQRVIPGAPMEQKRFEGDRIMQVLRSMGWVKVSDAINGDKISLSVKKVVKVEV